MSHPVARLFETALPLLATTQRALTHLQAPALLAARIYVGMAFFRSGLTKIADWDTTLALFADEYHVPFLPTHVAAVAGTFGELFFPVLLILGLLGRFSALSLSVVNIVAVISLSEIAPAALQQHQFWGALLAGVILWGPGKWAVDAWWWPKVNRR
ncbi:MAG TPA: DoxX family protein [Rhodoferax sp.]|nr:DoxX family protein [Rhodoferax sp.]